jgi:hypothetical protein
MRGERQEDRRWGMRLLPKLVPDLPIAVALIKAMLDGPAAARRSRLGAAEGADPLHRRA